MTSTFPAEHLYFLRRHANHRYNYNADHYHYHVWEHATRVEQNAQLLFNGTPPSLEIAALWHDAVYFPGAPNGYNEKLSALALLNAWKTLKIDDSHGMILQQAMNLIEATSIEDHLRTKPIPSGEWACLMDADLASLADPYPQFCLHQEAILQENFLDPTKKENLQKTVDFLTNLAGRREFIYHTQKARELWEATARLNIQALKENVRDMK